MVETAPIFVGDVVWMRLFRKQLTSASSGWFFLRWQDTSMTIRSSRWCSRWWCQWRQRQPSRLQTDRALKSSQGDYVPVHERTHNTEHCMCTPLRLQCILPENTSLTEGVDSYGGGATVHPGDPGLINTCSLWITQWGRTGSLHLCVYKPTTYRK